MQQMHDPSCLRFDVFRLDLHDERLWRDQEVLHLHPKTFAVLACLVAQAGQLVTKDALLAAVWPETVVSESVITVAIRELRRVLGDQARAPRMIETVHGRGYRFLAPVRVTASAIVEAPEPSHRSPSSAVSPSRCFVGREAERAQLAQWWATVQHGQRQVGLIAGEPGIGKTALVDAFVAEISGREDVWIGSGQCIDHSGSGEAYFPLLEALGRLCRGPRGTALIPLLQQYAPSWLVHLPALLDPAERQGLTSMASGVPPGRMLRELADALEVLTTVHPLVLILEDLHWSDHATLEWLAYVVRRRDPARLLILGTYRPVDAIVHAHPLRALVAELRHHPQYAELVLDYLSPAATAAYVAQRCKAPHIPPGLLQLLHQRTGGTPLFLVTMVDELIREGLLETVEHPGGSQRVLAILRAMIPTSLRQYIEQHVEQLAEADQVLLEAASVAGSTFTVAAVAAGVGQAPETLEGRYTALARHRQFIQASGTEIWPDGTITACYQFIHALYHEVVYARVSAGHRVRLHQQIGVYKEARYGAQARQIAGELAGHFRRGHDLWRAVHYLRCVGETAIWRSAYQEAIAQLTMGLEMLATLPESPTRSQQELALRILLGPALIATQGLASPEVGQSYAQARALCAQVGEAPQVFSTLAGIATFYRNKGALQTAREIDEQYLRLAQGEGKPMQLPDAHICLGLTLAFLGEYVAARTHFEQGRTLADMQAPSALEPRWGMIAPAVSGIVYAAPTLWCLGYPAQALRQSQEALTLAQALAHPHSLAMARNFAIVLHYLRRDAAAVQAEAEALLHLSTAQEFWFWRGIGLQWRGWALTMQGESEVGLPQLCQGTAAIVATGQELSRPFGLLLLAEAMGHTGRVAEGLRLLAKTLTACKASERRDLLAETYRLQGALLLRQDSPDTNRAEACFHRALTIAQRQQAKSFELRAAMSLGRLWQRQGKQEAAHMLLAPLYGWFTEGRDTADHQEAQAFLEALA